LLLPIDRGEELPREVESKYCKYKYHEANNKTRKCKGTSYDNMVKINNRKNEEYTQEYEIHEEKYVERDANHNF